MYGAALAYKATLAVATVPTVAEVNTDTRPYASVVMTGIDVALPTVVAPGPTAVKLIPVPLMVKLPAPLDVETTRVPLS